MSLSNTTMTLGEAYTFNRPRASSPYIKEIGEIAYERIKHSLECTVKDYKGLDNGYGNDTQNRVQRLMLVTTALKKKIQLKSDGSIRFSLDKLVSAVYKKESNQKKAIRALKDRTKRDLAAVLNHPNMTITEGLGSGIVSYRFLVRYFIHNRLEFGYFYRRYTIH